MFKRPSGLPLKFGKELRYHLKTFYKVMFFSYSTERTHRYISKPWECFFFVKRNALQYKILLGSVCGKMGTLVRSFFLIFSHGGVDPNLKSPWHNSMTCLTELLQLSAWFIHCLVKAEWLLVLILTCKTFKNEMPFSWFSQMHL